MRIGGAIVMLAVGAILTFAITVSGSHSFNINTVGIILMVLGGVWLLAELVVYSSRRRTEIVQQTPGGTTRTTTTGDPYGY